MHHENLPDDRRDPRQVFLVVQFLRNEKICGCNRYLHKSCQPEEHENGSHNCLLPRSTLAGILHLPGSSPRHTCDSLQSTDTPCAEFPSSRGSWKSTAAACPTKFPAPPPPPHPRPRTSSRRSPEISFPASILRAAIPAAPHRADPAPAPAP